MNIKKNFEKIGNISEEYGIANFEDTDYFKRAQDNEISLKCVSHIKVKHFGRATCDKVPEVKEIYERNKKIYENKFNGEYPYLNK